MSARITPIDPDKPRAPRPAKPRKREPHADRALRDLRNATRDPRLVAVPPHLVRGLVAAMNYQTGEVLFIAPAPTGFE